MLSLLKEFTEALIMALIVFLLLQLSVQNFRVEGSSMAPTIRAEEYLTVNKLAYLKVDMARFSRLIPFWDASDRGDVFPFQPDGPQRGDIIVFRSLQDSSRSFIKRVIGLPGEKVSLRRGAVYVDGRPMDESYLRTRGRDETREFEILGEDEYFVMGDNRPFSNDSRHWGPVPLENIIGNKLFNYNLPFDLGLINETE